jgi:dTDP-4-amino-4,6-dideoxygalactose transaminase
MRVPFAGVDAESNELLTELLPRIRSVLESAAFIGGDEVTQFERGFARLQQADYAVAVNSGTDALRLTMRALGVPRGGVGITVANTFVATVGAMVSEGLRPLLVDVGEDENIDPEALRRAITSDTVLLIAVHLRGWPARVDLLRELCAQRGVPLVEDCAQAVAATVNGRLTGTFGVAGCFSLHPLKNLGACGDGGVVVTNDAALAKELRLLRNHGLADRDTVVRWGENSRLDAVQAAALNVKLRHLPDWTQRRIELAEIYDEGLAHVPVVLPPRGPDRTHVFHRYTIRTPQREELGAHLAAEGIETAVHYPVPVHLQPAARAGGLHVAADGLPVTERQSNEILSLPLHPTLSEKQVRYVVERTEEFFDRAGAGAS